MNNPMSIYVSRLAETARQMCYEHNIIDYNQHQLDEISLSRIIGFYKGTLKKYSKEEFNNEFPSINRNSFLKKEETSTSLFKIGYIQYSVMDILHELGHAFLELADMKNNEVMWIRDSESGVRELAASKFARAFLMPTQLFQETVIDCSTKGVCDIEAVAMKFDVDASQVICRGRESYLWE